MIMYAFKVKEAPRIINYFVIFFAGFTFISMAVLTNSSVSQDRQQYFNNYLVAKHEMLNLISKDSLFNLFLKILPDGLNLSEFTAVVSFITFLLFVILIKVFEFKGVIQSKYLPYIIIIVLSDRLILDAFLNTVRSTWAIMIFIIGLGLSIGKKYRFFIITSLFSFGIHMGAALFSYASYVVYIFFKRYLIVIFSLLALIYSNYSDTVLIQFYSFISEYSKLEYANFVSVETAFNRNSVPTMRSFVQIFFAIILPLSLVLYRYRANQLTNNFNLEYVIIMSLFVMLTFLDLALIRRFFVIPIIYLLFYLRYKDLQILAIIKVFLFFGFSYGMF